MRHPYDKLIAYYAGLVGVGLIVGTLGPVLGQLAAQTGTTLQGVSVVLAMRPLGYLCGSLLSGRLLERRPGHPVLALAALAAAGLLALVPLTASLTVLALLILGMGLAQGLIDVGSNSLLTWVFHDRLGPTLSGMHFSFGVGAFAAPLLVALWLGQGLHPGWAFWGLSCYLLPLALLFSRTPSPAHSAPQAGPSAPADPGAVALVLACFFLYGGSEAGFGAWIYQYSLAYDAADTGRAAALSSAFWGLLGLGRLAGIPVLARWSPQRFLSVLLPLSAAAFATAVLWPGRPWSLWLGAAGAGLSFACVFPALQVFAGKSLAGGGRVSSRLTSSFFVASAGGSMVLAWLMGQLFGRVGPRAALAVPVIGAAMMTVLFWALRRRTQA